MDSFERFNESKLPDKSKFCGCGINKTEYQRAINVWKLFKSKTLGKYHGLYLETDVLFLCDVFEKFIKTCLEYYSLNPSHYFSSPGLSWDAMLKMTGIKIELINNIEIIEKLRISYFNNSHFI